MSKVLAHLRAQWIGVVALLIALGTGSAYAANTVFSADIVDGEVKAADLDNNAVRSTKIGTGQVLTRDLGADAVDGSKVADATIGAPDLGFASVQSGEIATDAVNGSEVNAGAIDADEIADGSVGSAELADFAISPKFVTNVNTSSNSTTQVKTVQTFCPNNQGRVVGGGHEILGSTGGNPNVAIRASLPLGVNNWAVSAVAPPGSPAWSLRVSVICAR